MRASTYGAIMQCDLGQGFVFTRPVAAEGIDELLRPLVQEQDAALPGAVVTQYCAMVRDGLSTLAVAAASPSS